MQRQQIQAAMQWSLGTLTASIAIISAIRSVTGICQTWELATTGPIGWALRVIFETAIVALRHLPS